MHILRVTKRSNLLRLVLEAGFESGAKERKGQVILVEAAVR